MEEQHGGKDHGIEMYPECKAAEQSGLRVIFFQVIPECKRGNEDGECVGPAFLREPDMERGKNAKEGHDDTAFVVIEFLSDEVEDGDGECSDDSGTDTEGKGIGSEEGEDGMEYPVKEWWVVLSSNDEVPDIKIPVLRKLEREHLVQPDAVGIEVVDTKDKRKEG